MPAKPDCCPTLRMSMTRSVAVRATKRGRRCACCRGRCTRTAACARQPATRAPEHRDEKRGAQYVSVLQSASTNFGSASSRSNSTHRRATTATRRTRPRQEPPMKPGGPQGPPGGTVTRLLPVCRTDRVQFLKPTGSDLQTRLFPVSPNLFRSPTGLRYRSASVARRQSRITPLLRQGWR